MKNVFLLFGLTYALCACTESLVVDYSDVSNNQCRYTETFRTRRNLGDYFGRRDTDLVVNYHGVKCETIINAEIKEQTHKKPYNSVEIVSEIPQRIEVIR